MMRLIKNEAPVLAILSDRNTKLNIVPNIAPNIV